MKNIQKIHRVLYAIGLGPLVGKFILLLTTTGRKSGMKRVTPLQYEVIGADYYVGAARGLKADWVQSGANPIMDVHETKLFCQCEVVDDPCKFADFLQVRLERHPRMIGLIMEKAHRLPKHPTRQQLEELAKTEALVILHPIKFSEN
jgi:hypothetical protein